MIRKLNSLNLGVSWNVEDFSGLLLSNRPGYFAMKRLKNIIQ